MTAKKLGISRKFLLPLAALLLVFAWAAWWWLDSAISCKDQDEDTVHGLCLIQLENQSKKGNIRAQWFYGSYLSVQNRDDEAYEWHRKAMAQAKIGIDLNQIIEPYCYRRVPGFEPDKIEATMQRVAKNSPDANLRLLQLYVNETCGAFNLEKASSQIPLLTQCASATLGEYFRMAKKTNYVIRNEAQIDIKANLAICTKELTNGRADGPYVVDFASAQQRDIDELSKMLAALDQ